MIVHNANATGKDNNVVKLCGTIVNMYSAPKAMVLTLGITENTRRGRQANYPKIYCFKDDNTGIEDFVLHDNVEITGHIATPMKTRPNGKMYASQAIIGDKVTKPSPVCAEFNAAEDNIIRHAPENLVFLHGRISSIRPADPSGTYAHIVVEATNKGHRNFVGMDARGDRYFLLKPGDIVDVYARVITRRKEVEGKPTRYYENIRPFSITVTEKKERKKSAEPEAPAEAESIVPSSSTIPQPE